MNWRALIAVVVSLGCLSLILTQVDTVALFAALKGISFGGLGLAAVLALIIPTFCAMRWRTVLLALGTELGFGQAYVGVMSAWVGNAVLPSKGGDFAKALIFGKEKSKSVLLVSVLVERIIDLFVLSTLALIGAIHAGWYPFAALIAVGMAIGLTIFLRTLTRGLPAPLLKRIPQRIRDKFNVGDIGVQTRLLPLALIWSSGVWLGAVTIFLILFAALGQPVELARLVGLIPLSLFVGMIPISISGIGTRDGALMYLLANFAASEAILAAGILYTALTYWLPAVVGIPFLFSVLSRHRSETSNNE